MVSSSTNAGSLSSLGLPTAGKLSNANDSVLIKQIGDDLYTVTINGDKSPSEYTKAQLESLSETGYFNGLGGKDNFEIDVYDEDLELTLNGGDDNDSFTFTNTGGQRVTFNQGHGSQGNDSQGGSGNPNKDESTAPAANATTPATATPAATPAAANPAPLAPIVPSAVTGNGNFYNSGTINNFGTTPIASVISNPAAFDLGAAVATGNSGLTQTAPGMFTGSLSGYTATVSQPSGAGSAIDFKLTVPDGALKDATIQITLNSDKSASIKVSGGKLTDEQSKSLTDLANQLRQDNTDLAFSSVKKKKGGGSSSTGAGAAASESTGKADGSAESVDGSSGLDGTSGLNTNVSDGADSWFMVLAVAMGTIMNKMAEKMIGLLNEIKAAGDNPPYALTSEFQATAQMLSFMQQAFMTALNSLGESIKTSVTAGGAAR